MIGAADVGDSGPTDRVEDETVDLYGLDNGGSEDTNRPWEVNVTENGLPLTDYRYTISVGGGNDAKIDLGVWSTEWTLSTGNDPHHEADRISGTPPPGRSPIRYLIVNAFSQRVAEYRVDTHGITPAPQIRNWIHTPDGELLAEHDQQTGAVLREYVWLNGEPLAMIAPEESDPGPHWHLNDHLGTPQVLVDGSQTVTWKARYEAFGKADVQVATVTQNLRFPGQYFDDETGLHYNWNRWYDPATGRYLQADPIGLAGGMDRYAYVDSDPVRFVDQLGYSKFDKLFGLPRQFWHWFHRRVKQPGDADMTKEEALEEFAEWQRLGRPRPDGKGSRQSGVADLDLLSWLIPWPLTPMPLACAELDCDRNGIPDHEEREECK